MSQPMPGSGQPNRQGGQAGRGLPTPPKGWPIGSYSTYAEAQRAVDYLSDEQFPVENVTIVGVDLMQVERITGRLTWGRVLGAGAASGAWLGAFLGLLVGLFVSRDGSMLPTLIAGIAGGLVFGLISAAVPYWASRGTRDFSSTMQLVAGRYDVLCDPQVAERARDMLARLNIR